MKVQIMEHVEQPNMTNMIKLADSAVPPPPQDKTKVHVMEYTNKTYMAATFFPILIVFSSRLQTFCGLTWPQHSFVF